MKTKYIKVPVSENRLPKDFTEVLVQYKNQKDFKEYSFFDSIHCKDEMIKGMDFWLEEVPDREEEMREMLQKIQNDLDNEQIEAWITPDNYSALEQLLTELKQTT